MHANAPHRRQHVIYTALAIAFAITVVTPAARAQPADVAALDDRLYANDRAIVESAVAEIERAAPDTPELEELLRKAGRECEDTLADPARALVLYERILRDFPHSSAARFARARAEVLRPRIGADGRYAREAGELARLVASADRLPASEVERRAAELAKLDWPGAPNAAMFLAEWLQRTGRLGGAQLRYAEVAARWPNTPHAIAALRGGADNAIAARDWDLAEALATKLPAAEPADRVLRDELLDNAARGRRLDFWLVVSWLALLGAAAALLASLAEAIARGGRRWPSPRPPIEVIFLLPVAAVLVGVALTTHQLIAPAVIALSAGGLVLTWLSGTALDLLRARRRRVALRAALHVTLCLVAVLGLLYIVLMRDNLLEMMIETVRFGPE